MKKLFTLLALACVAVVSADQGQNSQGYYQRTNLQTPGNLSNNQQSFDNTTTTTTTQTTKSVPDQELNKKIEDKVGPGWFSSGYKNVTFDVNNGIVTLRGFVAKAEDKAKVEDTIRKIDGVRQVNNQLTVNPNAK